MFSYPAFLDGGPDDEPGFTVTFRDIPDAITEGATLEEALAMAEEVLDLALSDRVANGDDLPKPSKARKGEVMVSASLPAALQMSLRLAMRDADVTAAELARRMNVDPPTVTNRLLKLGYNPTTRQMDRAFKALGRRPQIGRAA